MLDAYSVSEFVVSSVVTRKKEERIYTSMHFYHDFFVLRHTNPNAFDL